MADADKLNIDSIIARLLEGENGSVTNVYIFNIAETNIYFISNKYSYFEKNSQYFLV